MPTLSEAGTKTRAEATIDRGTLAASNSKRETTTRVRFEETREIQSAKDKAQSFSNYPISYPEFRIQTSIFASIPALDKAKLEPE
jgi:hypothetical protein